MSTRIKGGNRQVIKGIEKEIKELNLFSPLSCKVKKRKPRKQIKSKQVEEKITIPDFLVRQEEEPKQVVKLLYTADEVSRVLAELKERKRLGILTPEDDSNPWADADEGEPFTLPGHKLKDIFYDPPHSLRTKRTRLGFVPDPQAKKMDKLTEDGRRALRKSKFAPPPTSRPQPRLAHPGGPLATNKSFVIFLGRKLQEPGNLSSVNPALVKKAVKSAKETVIASTSSSGRVIRHCATASFGDPELCDSEDEGEENKTNRVTIQTKGI